MQGKKFFTPQLFVSVILLDMIPADNFYRKLLSELDLLLTKQKITINALNKEGTKLNFFLKAKKPIVKATPNAPIEVVRVIVKTVC